MTSATAHQIADRVRVTPGYRVVGIQYFRGAYAVHVQETRSRQWSRWIHSPEQWQQVATEGFQEFH